MVVTVPDVPSMCTPCKPSEPCSRANGAIIAATNIDPKTSQAAYGGGGSVIIAKVDYAYSSSTTKMFTGDIKMSNVFYSKPRRVAQIPAPASCSS